MEEAGWPQCRIPAFGEWNYYRRDDDAVYYNWSVTQRFDSAIRAPIPVCEPIKGARRRRRIPAFGEWNNRGHGDGSWPAAINHFFEPAAAHKPLNQLVRRDSDGVVAAGKQKQKQKRQYRVVRQSRVADTGARAASKHFSFTVVKAVDDDLYQVPPDMLYRKPTRKGRTTWLRSLLIGCLSPSCIMA